MFQQDSDVFSLVFCALESIHASLAVMAHNDMPKQLYHEEVCFSLSKMQLTITFCRSFFVNVSVSFKVQTSLNCSNNVLMLNKSVIINGNVNINRVIFM